MPTGYTFKVQDGTVTTFEEYAWMCARAFGALVTLRDEPLTGDIPQLEPSSYHCDKINEAKTELAALEALTAEERTAKARQAYADAQADYYRQKAEIKLQRQRYETMLAKAKAFRSPSSDHGEYAAFLIEQIEESIKWDCYERHLEAPQEQMPNEWYGKEYKRLKKDIEYHMKEYEKEVERTANRNRWIEQLKGAIDAVTASEKGVLN